MWQEGEMPSLGGRVRSSVLEAGVYRMDLLVLGANCMSACAMD